MWRRTCMLICPQIIQHAVVPKWLWLYKCDMQRGAILYNSSSTDMGTYKFWLHKTYNANKIWGFILQPSRDEDSKPRS